MGNIAEDLRAEMGKFPDKEAYIEGMVFSPFWGGDTPSAQELDKRRNFLGGLWDTKGSYQREPIETPCPKKPKPTCFILSEILRNISGVSYLIEGFIEKNEELDSMSRNALVKAVELSEDTYEICEELMDRLKDEKKDISASKQDHEEPVPIWYADVSPEESRQNIQKLFEYLDKKKK